jgi:hypothetical protein
VKCPNLLTKQIKIIHTYNYKSCGNRKTSVKSNYFTRYLNRCRAFSTECGCLYRALGFNLPQSPALYFVRDLSIPFVSEISQQQRHGKSDPRTQLKFKSRTLQQQVTLDADPLIVRKGLKCSGRIWSTSLKDFHSSESET